MLEHDRDGAPAQQTPQPIATPPGLSLPAADPGASRDAVPVSPLLPVPRRDLGYYQDDKRVQQFFGDRGVGYHLPVAALAHDQVWNDTYPQPYNGPLDLDNQGTAGPIETYEMRWLYRELYRREPSIRAAIKGKADAVACLDVSVIPQDDKNPADCEAAKFVKWTVENTLMGFDGMISQLVVHALIDGWSVMEKVLDPIKPERNRRYAGLWGLKHVRPLDTMFVRLQLDQFRNVLSVVNTVRGLEYYNIDKFLLFSYASLFNNPFGQSDLRACVRSCGLIQDAYQLWYLALKMFGLPYLHGKVDQPTNRKVMEAALAELRAGGYAVTSTKDEIQLLSLASAASFTAFEANIRAMREDNFLAVRGAYLPFMEGVGGTDAHGNTAISKVASDTNVDLLAKSVARVLTHQLVPWLVRDNFPSGTGYPTVTLGGVSWAEVGESLQVLLPMAKELRLKISKDQVYKRLNWAPPDGDDDALDMNQIEAQSALIQGQVQLQLQQQQMAAQAQMQQQAAQQPQAGAEGQEGASAGQEQGGGGAGDEFEMSPPQEEQGGGGGEFEMTAPQPAQMSDGAEDGYTPDEVLAAAFALADDPDVDLPAAIKLLTDRLGGESTGFTPEWEESKHPRDHGKFAKKPGAGAKSPAGTGTGGTGVGKREEKLATRRAAKAAVSEAMARRAKGKPLGHAEAKQLLAHMANLTHADLKELRKEHAATFRGLRLKAGRVDALVKWAKGEEYKARRGRQGSALQRVVDLGGIDPNSADFKRFYGSMKDAVNDGIPMAAFKRGGAALDIVAQQMRDAGDLGNSDTDPSERVIEMLRGRALVESGPDHDAEYDKHLRDLYGDEPGGEWKPAEPEQEGWFSETAPGAAPGHRPFDQPLHLMLKSDEVYGEHAKPYRTGGSANGESSRVHPNTEYTSHPVGSWKVEGYPLNYGHGIEQLVELDPHTLVTPEGDWTSGRNDEGRGDDARRYAGWRREGLEPPPISVLERDDGVLQVVDGHRRTAAAKLAGAPIKAWVNRGMDTGRLDSNGKPIRVGLTYEGAVRHALASGEDVPQHAKHAYGMWLKNQALAELRDTDPDEKWYQQYRPAEHEAAKARARERIQRSHAKLAYAESLIRGEQPQTPPPELFSDEAKPEPAQMSTRVTSEPRPGTRRFADKSGGKHKYACVYAPLGEEARKRLKGFHAQIKESDLTDRGYETEPHVTVRYGLHGDDGELDAALNQLGETEPFEVRFGNPSVFKGKEYDVIKLDLLDGFDKELRALHDRLGDLNHTDKFKDYVPHLTVAYVKAGQGEQIVKRMGYPRTTLKDTVSKLVYSDCDKSKRTIPLRGKADTFADGSVFESASRDALLAGASPAQVNRVLTKLLSEFAGAV